MFEAAFAPVRVPAGRQGGPRTYCAAGWSRDVAYKIDYKRSKDRSCGRSFSRLR